MTLRWRRLLAGPALGLLALAAAALGLALLACPPAHVGRTPTLGGGAIAFSARGNLGQFACVSPKNQVVAARSGRVRGVPPPG